jgi:DNA-binding NarL/FixJ family response regulator
LPEREDTLEMRLALLIQNAMALGIAGELGESRSALADFLELVSADSHEMRSQAVIFAAILDELLGTHEVGRHLLLGELAGVSDPKGPEAADLMRELAFTFFFDADWAAMRDAASGSLEAECEGMIRVGSLAALALADFGLGQPELMRPSVAEAARVFDSLSDPAIAAHHPGIAIWLGWAEVCTERFADAIGHLGRAIEVSRASGQRHHTVGLLSVQAQALAMIGEGQELRIAASDALEEALLSSSSLYLSWAMTTQCQVALWGGELVAAINFGEQALAAALQSKTPQADLARVQLASALIESGEAERGRALLISPEGEPDLPPFPFYETLCMELLVRAELAAGELESAEEHAGWALAGAERLGLELPISQARRASALVMAARKRWPDAAEEASASAAAACSAGAAVESARSMVIAAQATAAIGKRERAIEMLEAARKCFHESEATRYEEQAIRELRRLGRTVPRLRGEGRAQPGGLGLTNRELDVIALIVEGKTNREIAEELILSVRTVDRHVERIFSKLEVHSRAAAASVFERARLSG